MRLFSGSSYVHIYSHNHLIQSYIIGLSNRLKFHNFPPRFECAFELSRSSVSALNCLGKTRTNSEYEFDLWIGVSLSNVINLNYLIMSVRKCNENSMVLYNIFNFVLFSVFGISRNLPELARKFKQNKPRKHTIRKFRRSATSNSIAEVSFIQFERLDHYL